MTDQRTATSPLTAVSPLSPVPHEPGRTSTGPEQPRLRMRQRLSRWMAPRTTQSVVLEPLFNVVRENHPKADLALLERAYQTAERCHQGQTRKSGDAYITHPLAVTTILATLGMTEPTLCAALLHDTVEDTPYTMEELTRDFGPEIAGMVDGVTKLEKVVFGENTQAESLRKMIIAMSHDIRVLVIKLADRLHNMRTLGSLRPDKQNRIAKETLEIYAPLAHRLGMNTIKWELEDLAFSTMHPKVYDEIVHLVAENQPRRERYLAEIIEQVTADLAAARIPARVYGRPKHYYSIYQKMVVRGREFADIYDLLGLRVIVADKAACYSVMGVVHLRWNLVPGRIKDYIALPKFNMYQSLHTTVMGPGGRPIEFQIRSEEMHRRAEYGVAAHWKYKEDPNAVSGRVRSDGQDLTWLHELTKWQRETQDPKEFLDSLTFDLRSNEVFVFTPKGEIQALPEGATPVDFAYAVHTEVGHRCVGARVNGKLVSLDTRLNQGDTVDVMTSKSEDAGPSRDWLAFVSSPRARQKIRQYFTRERREESIERGKSALARQLRRTGMPMQRLLTIENLIAVATEFRFADVPALYAAIGESQVSAQAVVDRLIAFQGGEEAAAEESYEDQPVYRSTRRPASSDLGVEVQGDPSLWVKLARCCTPVPGDEILGFVTRGQGVSVHARDCTNVKSLLQSPERIVPVSWSNQPGGSFVVSVYLEGLDRTGLLAEVSNTMAEEKVSMLSASMQTGKDRVFRGTVTFETPEVSHLDHLMKRLNRLPGVYEVRRVRA